MQWLHTARRLVLACIALLTLAHSVLAQEELPPLNVPPPRSDILEHIESGKRIQGTYIRESLGKIHFKQSSRRQPLELSENEFRIVFRDGIDNAAELLDTGKDLVAQVKRELAAAELQQSPTPDWTQHERRWTTVRTILERIHSRAPQAAQAKRAIEELNPDLIAAAAKRREILVSALQLFQPLVALFEQHEYEKLDPQIQAVRAEIDLLLMAEAAETADDIRKRTSEILQDLSRLADELKPLPTLDSTTPPENLLDLAEQARHQIVQIDSCQALALLGVTYERRTAMTSSLAAYAEQADRTTEQIKPLLTLLDEHKALQNELSTGQVDGNLLLVRYQQLMASFGRLEKTLNSQPVEPATRYALEHLRQHRPRLEQAYIAAQIAIHAQSATRDGNRINQITTLRELQLLQDALQSRATALAELKKDNQRLDLESRVDLNAAIQQVDLALARSAFHQIRIDLNQLQSELQRLLSPLDSVALAEGLSSAEALKQRLDNCLQNLSSAHETHPLANGQSFATSVPPQLQRLQHSLEVGLAALRTHQQFTLFPASMDTPEQLQVGKQRLAAAEEHWRAAQASDDGVLPEVQGLLQRTETSLVNYRQRVADAEPGVRFGDLEQRFLRLQDELQERLRFGDVLGARQAQRDLNRQLQQFDEMLGEDKNFSRRDELLAGRQRYETVVEQHAAEIQRLLDVQRRAQNWQPLPLETDTEHPTELLLPPTIDSQLLAIEQLVYGGKFAEARTVLRDLKSSEGAGHAPWPSRIESLEQQITFREALALEKREAYREAATKHKELIATAQDHEMPSAKLIVAASTTALSRLESLMSQRSSQQYQRQFVFTALMSALLLAVVVGLYLWRDSGPMRLRRAARWLDAALASDSIERRNAYLHRAAMLLARFPESHEEARNLRQRLAKPVRQVSAARATQRLETTPSTLHDTVDDIISAQVAGSERLLHEWLNKYGADPNQKERRDRVIARVQQLLAPTRSADVNRLLHIAEASAALVPSVPEHSWPRLYQVAALWWAGRQQQAAEAVKALSNATPSSDSAQAPLWLAAALAHMHDSRLRQADAILKVLMTDKQLRSEVQRWRRIAAAASRANSKQLSGTPQYELIQSLLT